MREQDFLKYLRRNPGPELPELARFAHAVVIPAYREREELPAVLDSLARNKQAESVAVIVVVNHPAGSRAAQSLELLEHLRLRRQPRLFTLYAPDLTGGVGEARKAGMDCFVRSRRFGELDGCFIFSLDADSPVAENYFSTVIPALDASPTAPGTVIGIRHRPAENEVQEQAVRAYERYLFRYAEKLSAAGSPYGFVSIGSGFAVRTSAYVKAGGMRKKKAGEDFYFLQELAKQGPPLKIAETLVFPSPRLSARVPFGTGQAVKNLLGGGALDEIPDFAFEKLAELLADANSPDGFLSDPAQTPPGDTAGFFEAEKFGTAWRSILANTPPLHEAKLKAFHRWFDGLKTLRFLHALQRQER